MEIKRSISAVTDDPYRICHLPSSKIYILNNSCQAGLALLNSAAMARDVIIKNGCVITGDGPVYPDGYVHISDGRIAGIGNMDGTRDPGSGTRIIDAGGRYVLPGFINPHMHFYGLLARGMKVARMRTFGAVLNGLWWKLDRALTLDDVYVSALLGGIEAIRAGVTTVFDHHASYGAISGSMSEISRAMDELGLRASLCFEISDRAGKRARDEAVTESAHLLDSVRGHARSDKKALRRAMVGLHASMTLSDGTLDAARELMDIYEVGAHVHVAEGEEDVAITKKRNRATPVARFVKAGILRPGSIAAHCVHVTPADIALLKKCGATVAHNPLSNLNNAVGIAPILEFFKRRIPVVVGTDGMSAGISDDVRLAAFLQKPDAKDAQAGGDEIRRAVWEITPELVSDAFGIGVGTLKEDAAADVIIAEAMPPTEVTAANAWWHVLFGVLTAQISTTIIAGEVRMQNFKLPGIDEAALACEARDLSARLWRRL